MAKKKWRAHSSAQWDDRTPFQRFRWPVLAAVVVAGLASIAWYRYSISDYKYGDNATDYEREVTKCIQDRTRHAADDDNTAVAATDCVEQDDNGMDKNLAP
jgi:hypothetical protein